MKKTKCYKLRLYDTDSNIYMFYEVETAKSLKQFLKDYDRIREQWYYREQYPLPLDEYLTDELEKCGHIFYKVEQHFDLELYF